MLPLNLPLPLSTEITMQSLMKEASNYLDSGRLKISYELYIEALLSAIKEFKQLEFIDQCVVVENNNLSSVFMLAHTCLRHAKTISSLKTTNTRPPIPPKPSNLKIAPPLPMRPVAMSRAKSKPEFVEKPCNYSNTNLYTDEDDYSEYDYSDDYSEDDDEEEEEEENSYVNTKTKAQQTRKASAPSLKILKGNSASNRPKIPRRSSTSNLSSTSAPSSPLSSVPNPLNAVKSFLSLPGSMASHTTNRTGMYSIVVDSDGIATSGDAIFLLANSTIDPHVLITVQTSNSDSLSTPTGFNSSYLPMIPQAPLVTVYQSLQKQLEEAFELKKQRQDVVYANQQVLEIQSSLNQVRNIHMSATTVPTILQFQPVLIAYQLTLIDSTIFRNIPIDAILSHAPKTPHPSIVASTDFFNYLTRLIEHAILLQQDASGRAQHINHWIKVAGKCHELKNYQTLKAVISALGTPPIQRLKRSWQFIPKKSMNLLEDLSDLMSEASNYGKYRHRLGLSQSSSDDEVKNRGENEDILSTNTTTATTSMVTKKSSTRKNSFSEPTVPFLGIFIHDMTYLVAALSKKKQQQHNSGWTISPSTATSDVMQQDSRVSELLRLFKNLQRSPPYSPNLSAPCIKDLTKNRKRKLSHALTRTTAIKRAPAYYQDDDGELSIEMQQCLVTQYLLTRSWVSEKTVDELSLVREPTKRSISVTDSLSSHHHHQQQQQQQQQQLPPPPPPLIISTVSLTTNDQQQQQQQKQQQQQGGLRRSSGSFTSGGSNSSNSRPISLEDEQQQENEMMDKKNTGFWLFGRKSADQGYLKEASAYGTMQRSPRHFSFEDLNSNRKQHATIPSLSQENSGGTFRMHREGSQGSLASSIFRKDFWKGGNQQQQQQQQQRNPLSSFNSDPSLMQRKGSSASSVLIHPSPSTSSSTSTSVTASSNRPLNNKNLRHVLSSPHPLDMSSTKTEITTIPTSTTATPLSEISSFNWD